MRVLDIAEAILQRVVDLVKVLMGRREEIHAELGLQVVIISVVHGLTDFLLGLVQGIEHAHHVLDFVPVTRVDFEFRLLLQTNC